MNLPLVPGDVREAPLSPLVSSLNHPVSSLSLFYTSLHYNVNLSRSTQSCPVLVCTLYQPISVTPDALAGTRQSGPQYHDCV